MKEKRKTEDAMTPNDSVRNVQLTNQGCRWGDRDSVGSRSALFLPQIMLLMLELKSCEGEVSMSMAWIQPSDDVRQRRAPSLRHPL